MASLVSKVENGEKSTLPLLAETFRSSSCEACTLHSAEDHKKILQASAFKRQQDLYIEAQIVDWRLKSAKRSWEWGNLEPTEDEELDDSYREWKQRWTQEWTVNGMRIGAAPVWLDFVVHLREVVLVDLATSRLNSFLNDVRVPEFRRSSTRTQKNIDAFSPNIADISK